MIDMKRQFYTAVFIVFLAGSLVACHKETVKPVNNQQQTNAAKVQLSSGASDSSTPSSQPGDGQAHNGCPGH